MKPTKLNTQVDTFKRIAKLPAHKALNKFIAFRTEMVFDSLGKAASALDDKIEVQVERLREHSKLQVISFFDICFVPRIKLKP